MTKQTVTLLACLLLLIGPAGLAGAAERDGTGARHGSSPVEWIATWIENLVGGALGALEEAIPVVDPHQETYRANSGVEGDPAAPVPGGSSPFDDPAPNDDGGTQEGGPLIEPLG